MIDCVPDHHASRAVTAHLAQELHIQPVGRRRVVGVVYEPRLACDLATQNRLHPVRFTVIDARA